MNELLRVRVCLLDRSNEWYTPACYVEAARFVMGGIELDPASCAEANRIVQASRYYTQLQDGFAQDWTCSALWLNPPFGRTRGKSNIAMWTARLLEEYHAGRVTQAVLLCMANTEAGWFQPLWGYPLCFPYPRVRFHRPDGTMEHHIQGTAFAYLGEQRSRFVSTFQQFGPVVTPDGVHRVPVQAVQPVLLAGLPTHERLVE